VGVILLASSSVLSRLLGVLRDYVFSKIFGIGDAGGIFALDAYFVAFKIPDFLYTLLILGAMSTAFIPMYTGIRKEDGEKKASEFASNVILLLFILLPICSVLAFFLAPYLMPFLAPGFSPELQDTSVYLTRIMLLSPFFMGLSGLFQGIENAHKKFLGLALAPIFYNLAIIVSAYFFGSKYGVNALAIGVVIGALCHFLVQVPGTLLTPFKFKITPPIFGKDVKEFFTLLLPRLFGNVVFQASTFVDTLLATTISLGSLSIYNYALNLESFPYGVVAISFSTAIFSTLSEQSGESENFFATLKQAILRVMFLVIPATVGLYFLREPLIRVLLAGGQFDENAVHMTTLTLGFFIWAAIPQSLITLFSRGFYSRKETWLPVYLGTIGMLFCIALSVIFIKVLDLPVYGLAFSNVIATTLYAGLLGIVLLHQIKVSVLKLFDVRFIVALFSGLILMFGALFAVDHYFASQPILMLILGGSFGALAYFAGFFGVKKVIS